MREETLGNVWFIAGSNLDGFEVFAGFQRKWDEAWLKKSGWKTTPQTTHIVDIRLG